MRRLWLIFAQVVTVSLAVLFVLTTLRPGWIHLRAAPPAPTQASPAASVPAPAALREQTTREQAGSSVVSFSAAVQHAAPAVVNVYTAKHVDVPVMPLPDNPVLQQFFNQLPGLHSRQESTSLGSGVIISNAGYVLTNYHVVESADAIEVALADGRQSRAKIVGLDPDTDLAVLKINIHDLPVAQLAVNEPLHVGDVVLAIGNPFGVGQTTTMGIVSALGRNQLGLSVYENFIQTDAAINPGNSGGALINTKGDVVGINTAIYSRSGGSLGIGFAIPIDTARQVMEQIIHDGHVLRGWLGIEPQDITPDLARSFHLRRVEGVIIAGVVHGSPADKVGLRVGDIVLDIDRVKVQDTTQALETIAALKPNETVSVTILRRGKTRNVKVKVGLRPALPN